MFTNNCVLILFSLIILFLEEIFGVVIIYCLHLYGCMARIFYIVISIHMLSR